MEWFNINTELKCSVNPHNKGIVLLINYGKPECLTTRKCQNTCFNIWLTSNPIWCRWLKFEEDVEDGGERWSKPYVATLSLHSLFELRSCILNGTVMLDMRANTIEEIAGNVLPIDKPLYLSTNKMNVWKMNVSLSVPRHGNRQHGGIWAAGREFEGEGAGCSAEETSPPEWEETQQSHPTRTLLRRHRQETFRPAFAWEEWWDLLLCLTFSF